MVEVFGLFFGRTIMVGYNFVIIFVIVKYFFEDVRNKKEMEFLELKQGSMTG